MKIYSAKLWAFCRRKSDFIAAVIMVPTKSMKLNDRLATMSPKPSRSFA